MQTFWTEHRRATLRQLWADRSLSRATIANRLGCSPREVTRECRRMRLKPRPRGRRGGLQQELDGGKIPVMPAAMLPESAIPWPSRDRLMAGR